MTAAAAMLPAYCDPPNPCPLGYTEADGCLDEFENSSEFSRIYQVLFLIIKKDCFLFLEWLSCHFPVMVFCLASAIYLRF